MTLVHFTKVMDIRTFVFKMRRPSLLVLLLCFRLVYAQTPALDSLKAVLPRLPADSNKVKALIQLSGAQSRLGIQEAREYASELLDLSRRIKYAQGEAMAYNFLAYGYYKESNDPKAIELLFKAMDIFKELHKEDWVAGIYNNIGLIYFAQDDTHRALIHFIKAYDVWKMMGIENAEVAKVLWNIASVHQKEGNDSLALNYYRQALAVSEEVGDQVGASNALNEIGKVHFKNGEYDMASELQQRALELALEANSITMQARAYGAISEVMAATKQFQRALEVALKALDKARQVNSKADIESGYRWVSDAYRHLNDYKKAYEFQSLYIALHDSLKTSEKIRAIERTKSNYEMEKKEREIESIKHYTRIQQNIFIGSFISLFFIGALLYSRQKLIAERKITAKKNRLLLYMHRLKEKSEMVERITKEMESLKINDNDEQVQVEKFNRLLQLNIHTDEDWENFKKSFEDVYPGFFAAMRFQYPDITQSELRLSALIKLKLSLKESATVLGISLESVKKARYRLRKKINLPETQNLEEFIQKTLSKKAG